MEKVKLYRNNMCKRIKIMAFKIEKANITIILNNKSKKSAQNKFCKSYPQLSTKNNNSP